jgi:hypothetical protein
VYETMDALKDTKVIDNIETIKRKQMLKGWNIFIIFISWSVMPNGKKKWTLCQRFFVNVYLRHNKNFFINNKIDLKSFFLTIFSLSMNQSSLSSSLLHHTATRAHGVHKSKQISHRLLNREDNKF